MNNIHLKFSDRFRSHWIKVKFYKDKPNLNDVKKLENVRFCEATEEAISFPVLLNKESINCPGAQYAFGWENRNELLNYCLDKGDIQKDILQPMLSYIPHLKEPFQYIALNTEGEPDIIISYILPESAMDLVKLYQNKIGEKLDVSLCSIMPICSGITVRTYLEEMVTFSFGCDDSRKYAKIDRSRLAVGIPKKFFNLFVA